MDERIEYCIDAELRFTRAKFPHNTHNLAALMEEVGELAQALMHHARGKATSAEVFAEAIQVAVMAIRVAEEGSAEFPYCFTHADYQAFEVQKDCGDTTPKRGAASGRGPRWVMVYDEGDAMTDDDQQK